MALSTSDIRDPTVRRLVYPPAGRCIYCGCEEPPLTKEHIVPSGLGGRMELPFASCATCQKITTGFEGVVQQGILLPVRARLNLLSPKRRKKHPTQFKEIQYYDGKTETMIETLIKDHPTLLTTLVLPDLPKILTGDDDNGAIRAKIRIGPPINKEASKILMSRDSLGTGFKIKATIKEFGQMLAKIAHAFSYAEGKFAYYTPTLTEIVRDQQAPQSRFIGGDEKSIPRTSSLHEIGFVDRDDGLLIVRFRMFARYGGSVYYTVSGIRGEL